MLKFSNLQTKSVPQLIKGIIKLGIIGLSVLGNFS